MAKKTWNRVRNVTGRYTPMTQNKIMRYLVDEVQDQTFMEYTGLAKFEGVWVTPIALREMGMVICSDCGSITSDSRYECPDCGEQLVVVMHDPAKHSTELDDQIKALRKVTDEVKGIITSGIERLNKLEQKIKKK